MTGSFLTIRLGWPWIYSVTQVGLELFPASAFWTVGIIGQFLCLTRCVPLPQSVCPCVRQCVCVFWLEDNFLWNQFFSFSFTLVIKIELRSPKMCSRHLYQLSQLLNTEFLPFFFLQNSCLDIFVPSREGKVTYPSPVPHWLLRDLVFYSEFFQKGLEMWAEWNYCHQLWNTCFFFSLLCFAFVRNGPGEICSVMVHAQGT